MGLVRKPQTFHLVLYPLVVELNVKCRGSVETDADVSRDLVTERTDGFEGIRLEGLKLALIQNYKSTFTFFLATALFQLQDNVWLTQNEAVNADVMYTGQGGIHERKAKKRVVYFQDDSSDLSC